MGDERPISSVRIITGAAFSDCPLVAAPVQHFRFRDMPAIERYICRTEQALSLARVSIRANRAGGIDVYRKQPRGFARIRRALHQPLTGGAPWLVIVIARYGMTLSGLAGCSPQRRSV